jgi:hypothetical protein
MASNQSIGLDETRTAGVLNRKKTAVTVSDKQITRKAMVPVLLKAAICRRANIAHSVVIHRFTRILLARC